MRINESILSIYYVRPDFQRDPYQSVLVAWVGQDEDRQWMYRFVQTDNECSPWDLALSDFVLPQNVKQIAFPDSVCRRNVKAQDILNYLKW